MAGTVKSEQTAITALLILTLTNGISSPIRAAERLPEVLIPSADTYRFVLEPGTSEASAPLYLKRLLPVLKQAIRARLSAERRLRAAAGHATRLDQVLQEYAGAQQTILRQISQIPPPPEAQGINDEIVSALYWQMQFFRHYATWLYEDPARRVLDEVADSRLQGCHQALEKVIALTPKAFPKMGQAELRVFRAHIQAMELL